MEPMIVSLKKYNDYPRDDILQWLLYVLPTTFSFVNLPIK